MRTDEINISKYLRFLRQTTKRGFGHRGVPRRMKEKKKRTGQADKRYEVGSVIRTSTV